MADKKYRKTNVITGTGTLIHSIGDKIVRDSQELGIGGTFIAKGGPEFNRISLGDRRIKLPGVKDLGLTPGQSKSTSGWLGDEKVAEAHEKSWLPVVHQINEYHIGAVRDLDLNTLFCLFIYSLDSGHTKTAKEMLKELASRLPDEVRIGLTVIPHEKYLREGVSLQPDLPLTLKDQGLLECTGVIDNLETEIVRNFGRGFQDKLVTKGIASMMASIWQFQNMRSPADVTHALGRFCAQFGFSFGLRSVAPDPELSWYRPIRQIFGWQAKGSGNVEDIAIQTIDAAKDALTNPAWRAIDEEIDENKQAFLVFTVPTRTGWQSLIPEVERWLSNNYPFVTALWARGPGTPHPHMASALPYWVQATLLFPLPDRPRAIQKIVEAPTMLRRSPAPDNGKSNTGQDAEVFSQTRSIVNVR